MADMQRVIEAKASVSVGKLNENGEIAPELINVDSNLNVGYMVVLPPVTNNEGKVLAVQGNQLTWIDVSTLIDDLSKQVEELKLTANEHADAMEVDENGLVYLLNNSERIAGPYGPFAGGKGGSGGSQNNATMALNNTSGFLSKTVSSEGSCPIKFNWSSTENDLSTGPGTLTILVNGISKAIQNVDQGDVEVDLKPYLQAGTNRVRIRVSDAYDNIRTLNFTITSIAISLESQFDDTVTFNDTIEFIYTPIGNVKKTIHFLLDGSEVNSFTTSVSNRQLSYTFDHQNHGMHSIECYFTSDIDGNTIESNHLYYEIISVDLGNKTPIIASDYRVSEVEQYTSLPFTFRIYDPTSLTAQIKLYANDVELTSLNVNRNQQTFTYRPDNVGTLKFKIEVKNDYGTVSKEWSINVTESSIKVEAVTENLDLALTSYGRSNNEEDPSIWTDGKTSATLENFNFISDGWKEDDDQNTVLRVTGDARVTIPIKIFANDFRTTGKTISLEFATSDVLNYDSTLISCMSGGRGFEVTSQMVRLVSEQSEISTQFKENEHVRIDFVVEKRSEHRLIEIYINGVMSGAIQYPDSDDFSQKVPVDITIGSNDVTTDIYCIRVYNNDLTRFQIVNNWIADTQDITEKLARYSRNNVFDDYGKIVIDNLPHDLPYVIIEADQLPQYKGDKKTVKITFRDPSDSSKDFVALGVVLNVQGTSSQYYPVKNYKANCKLGFTDDNNETESTYKMNKNAIPTKEFCFKADFASSEGANNVELVKLYNDICPYKTPAQKKNPLIRQGIDGFPMVGFWNKDGNVSFLGKYNFNNDKGTSEVYGFTDGDESWEISNNTSNRVLWKSNDYSNDDWQNDFESRFPEDYFDYAQLKAFADWVVQTDTTAVTGNALPGTVTYDGTEYLNDTKEYRLAKFKNELSNYVELDDTIFYYLFTELFLMVDSRAKNAFPSFIGSEVTDSSLGIKRKIVWLPYDMDTAIGINNEGALVFSYYLEDIDTLEGAKVFNGQDSVLWCNLRDTFGSEIASMYKDLRSKGILSYESVEKRFENHQKAWPEALVNEDSWIKYIQPMIDNGTTDYLQMLQGLKTLQRMWWLFNRFRYMDSKYNAGDAFNIYINLRGYAKSNITVTPYADIYPAAKFGSYFTEKRGKRNKQTELVCGVDTLNDTEIAIYSADQLADVGDLSGLKVGFANFSMATKLQSIKIGDASESYDNPNLTNLSVGANVLLHKLDVRNCSKLAQAVDLTGCSNIEEVYFDGTSITGVELPNGGILKILHLPGTVTNLTLLNQTALTDFTMPSYSNITTLRLENNSSVVDYKSILNSIAEGSRVRILGFAMEATGADEITTLFNEFDKMRGLDESGNNVDKAQISGTIHTDSLTGAQIADFNGRYPYVKVTADHTTSYLQYYTYDGSTLLNSEVVKDGGDGGTYTGKPSRASTPANTFEFIGWSRTPNSTVADPDFGKAVTADRKVYAAYKITGQVYTVKYKNGNYTLQTINNVPYGTDTTYTGETPVMYEISYKKPDGTVYYSEKIYKSGDNGTYTGTPSKPSTERYNYTFAGWSKTEGGEIDPDAKKNITKSIDLYPVYTESIRTYSVKFSVNGTIKETYSVPYGGSATYKGDTSGLTDADGNKFIGWKPEPTNIQKDTTCVAQFFDQKTVSIPYADFIAAVKEGTSDYKVGNYIPMTLSDGNTYNARIVGKNADQLADGSGNAKYSIILDELLPVGTHKWNPSLVTNSDGSYKEGTGNIGGWEKSEIRTYYKNTLKPMLPEDLQKLIKPVKKSYTYWPTAKDGTFKKDGECTDDVWMPSLREMGYDYPDQETYGPIYSGVFTSNSTRQKHVVNESSNTYYWLRSANSNSRNSAYFVSSNGDWNHYYVYASYYLALGFCI